VWWSPAFVLPRGWHGPAIITVHDLVFLLRPELYRGRLRALYFARATRWSARRAGRVLCPSAATADRAVAELGIDREKVVVAPWGIAEAFRRPPARDEGNHVLFVGRWEARKGLDVLHQALRDLAARGLPLRLVLAGGPGWGAEEAVRALREDPAVEVVIDPGDERLAALYAGAMALVYPSRMEGFGLPVAEAMSCGCPVIASDLPEIRGWAQDGPAYVPAGDAGALADALGSLAGDPERRARMSERGRAIAAGLSWAAHAEIAAEAIEAAADRSAAP
jgi:glycosyltransferase involved in cell wall biosynthesis